MEKDLDKAASYFNQALEMGYLNAKQSLDRVFDETREFRNTHPDYQKWIGDYEDYKNKEIILF